jgi:opacity protein-like surface antigen
LIRKAFPLLAAALLVSTLGSAHAQTSAPPTAFGKQLDKVDLSIAGVGLFNTTVTGPVLSTLATNYCVSYPPAPAPPTGCGANDITQFGSNTAGALVSIHYPVKPYIGLEFNYGYGRYTENFEGPGVTNFLPTNTTHFQVQTKVSEYTLGYLITPPHPVFGLQPFASVGVGAQAFKPTAFGGQEEPEKARMTYYYSLGLQKDVNQHLGLRLGFRQLFFLDPDFGQNYLTILKHASTYEPMVGFYLRY